MKLMQMTSHLLKQLSSTLKGVKFLVIKECATYDIVDVTGLVYNLQTEAGHEKDGKLLPIWKGMIKGETGSREIVRFSLLVDEFLNNTSYDFKKMRVQKFMNNHILKSTETAEVFNLKKQPFLSQLSSNWWNSRMNWFF